MTATINGRQFTLSSKTPPSCAISAPTCQTRGFDGTIWEGLQRSH
jgi:hypothetical protein